jgi:hypothetical protein
MSAGYRNPPKAGQFKKGRSGNSKGRPRQAVRQISTAYLFRKVAAEQLAIEVDGAQVTMTRWEAMVRQVHNLALNKDASAARLIHKLRKQFPGNPVEGDKFIMVVSDIDLKV